MRILFVRKENKKIHFIQQFLLFPVSFRRAFTRVPRRIRVVLLTQDPVSMYGQKALRFCQKYCNLFSKDEQRSYGFGTTWGWVINERTFIFRWTNPLIFVIINFITATCRVDWADSGMQLRFKIFKACSAYFFQLAVQITLALWVLVQIASEFSQT